MTVCGGCHPDPRLGPILGPSRSHPGSEVVPSRFAMCFVLQCFGPIQVPRSKQEDGFWPRAIPDQNSKSHQDRNKSAPRPKTKHDKIPIHITRQHPENCVSHGVSRSLNLIFPLLRQERSKRRRRGGGGHPGPSWSHPAPERSLQDRAWTGRNRLLGHFRV